MSDQPDALRQAAAMLLNAAPSGAVIRAVKTLLDAMEADRPVMPAAEPAQTPPQAAQAINGADAAPTPTPAPAAAAAPARATFGEAATKRAEWEQLRVTVREMRTERGLSIAQLAVAIGSSATTLKTALGMKRPPSHRLRERLEAWVAAPEVAAEPAVPFRVGRTGNGRTRSNGAGDHAGAGAAAD
jgi:hypothetical protein